MAVDEPETEAIGQRVRGVLARIEEAAERAGRPQTAIRLVAATKSVPVASVRTAVQAGVRILGENRLQEALPKIEALGSTVDIAWHFIGRLQRRKVRTVVGLFQMIHSVDGLELAQEIDRRAASAGVRQAVLLEVNIGGEATKAGFSPSVLLDAAGALDELSHLDVQGLMAVPPPSMHPEQARGYFRRVRELAGKMDAKGLSRLRMKELSMGMSGDFEVAIEEGATLVRIGTAIFGPRPPVTTGNI